MTARVRGRDAPAPVARPLEPRAGAVVVGAVVLFALNMRTVIASLPPLLATVRDDLGLSATVAGLLTTLPVLCFGALAPLVPRLARRFALERVLVACAALTAAAAAARGIASTPALFAASILAGCSVAVGQAALPVLIRARFAAAIGLLTGAYSMALPLGATLAAAAAVPLERALGHSWPRSLASWALPALLATGVWVALARRSATTVSGPPPAPLRMEPLAWAVAVYFGLQSASFYAGLAWIPEILESHGYSAATAGALQAVNALVSMGPALLVPIVAARLSSQRPLLFVIVGVAAAGVLGLLLAPGAGLLWVALIGLGQGGQLGLALIFPVLRARSPQTVASLTAMTFSVGYLIAATGPWILGLVHDAAGGWSAALAAMLAITLLQLVPGLPASRDRVLASEPS